MKSASNPAAGIILGMRKAYSKGENAMEWCREYLRSTKGRAEGNDLFATLVAYDLQAGSYVAAARAHRENNRRWCGQVARLLADALDDAGSILEVGVGEATTLGGVLSEIGERTTSAFGFDVSWSRVAEGKNWLAENGREATLFVADLLNIPMADGAVDVVYSSHSLEPNRGKEEEALRECLRVARRAVVLIEPLYELACPEAQSRMKQHGYVEGLRETAERLGAEVLDYRLLDYAPNPLNPSGVLYLGKSCVSEHTSAGSHAEIWRCPITGAALKTGSEFFHAPEVGLAYPNLCGIPMLRTEHGIIASKLSVAVGV